MDARQATNDRAIEFTKELIRGLNTPAGYQIRWDRFGESGEDDDRARAAIAHALAKTRGHAQADEIDHIQAVHAVNALNNAGAEITWPPDESGGVRYGPQTRGVF